VLDSLALNDLPLEPGIYKMLDAKGEVLYVGKAKHLKKRVTSYFLSSNAHSLKTLLLVSKIARIETIVTRSEQDALVLERQLIQNYQPRYNIALKDDKNYPYIKLTGPEPFPKVTVVRQRFNDGGRYFGPYPSMGSTKKLLRFLYDLFPLRDCKQAIDLAHKQPKCIKLDLEKCLGPCIFKQVKPDYDELVNDLVLFLSGKNKQLETHLNEQMKAYAMSLQYEKAAKVRDRLRKLDIITQQPQVNASGFSNVRVWTMAQNELYFYALVQTFIEGKLLYQNGFYLEKKNCTQVDFLQRALFHFSEETQPVPIDETLCDEAFYEVLKEVYKSEGKACKVPQKGEKKVLLQGAQKNCQMSLERIGLEVVQYQQHQVSLDDVKRLLELNAVPKIIMGIDISHLQGTEIVGAVVYFKEGKPFKNKYRTFRIKSIQGQSNDPASIYEVVLRRLKMVFDQKEEWPQLLMIDGGKPQLHFAYKALELMGLHETVELVALAKKEEILYKMNRKQPIVLEKQVDTLKLMQRIRDEVHRFVLTFQRKRRRVGLQSKLDLVPGLGKHRVNLLLKTFGSIEGVQNASEEELSKAPGIGLALAKRIRNGLSNEKA